MKRKTDAAPHAATRSARSSSIVVEAPEAEQQRDKRDKGQKG